MSRILLVGDTFGRPGREAIYNLLPGLISEKALDFVIVNAENVAGGKGLTPEICHELFAVGVDVITTGNHLMDKKEILPMLETDPRILRPINFSSSIPGSGSVVRKARNGRDVAVVNAMGTVHFRETNSPFEVTKNRIVELKAITPVVFLDFHAEATSEKRAMGWYLDGIASAVFGTHTHVQTADEEILPQGTGFLTDVGMTGPYHSVIGLRVDLALDRFLRNDRSKFEVGKGNAKLCGAIADIDDETGKTRAIDRIQRPWDPSSSS